MAHKFTGGIIAKATKAQIRVLSDIIQNIGYVCFGSLFLESFIRNSIHWTMLLLGLATAFVCWTTSLLIIK